MITCKVLFFELTPVYALFNDGGDCVGDGIAPMVKIYPGKPINMARTQEDIERAFSCTTQLPTKPGE